MAGIDVLADPIRVRHAIGVVGQKHGGVPEATGRENLISQGEFYGITGRELRQRVGDSLERFGLTDAADRPVKTYSGGMQRRLDIAMGLLHRPQVLFLDEPTTGLDPEARAEMWREIERLAGEELMTILLTTHYMEEADRLASRLAIVDRGRVVVRGHARSSSSAISRATRSRSSWPTRRRPAPVVALDGVAELGEARLEGASIYARARDGGAAIPAVLAALEAHGVEVTSVTLRGRRSTTSTCDTPAAHSTAPTRARGGGGMTAVRQTWQVTLRGIRVFVRNPAYLAMTLTQPIIWLLLFGALFKAITKIPGFHGGSYINFLTPGIVVMLAVSSAGWTGMGFIEDIASGVMDRELVSPVWRGALNAGTVHLRGADGRAADRADRAALARARRGLRRRHRRHPAADPRRRAARGDLRVALERVSRSSRASARR